MAVSVESSFFIIGGIILIGYAGEIVSKKSNIPSALLLLLIGYLLKLSGYVHVDSLLGIRELFGTLALIVLLFDGGISLNLNTLIFKSGRVLLTGALITFVSIFACAAFFSSVLGLDPLIGAIFGALAGGIGSATTISILKGLSLPKEIDSFLTLESSLTDVFSIILTIVLTQALISGSLDFQFLGQGIASSFSVGVILGLVFGLASILVLSKIEKGYNYVVTLSLMFLIYAVTEIFGGSGAIAVLLFGVVFGNETSIRKILRMEEAERKFTFKEVQSEISFFIRTFFLVFLGAVVNVGGLGSFVSALFLMILLYMLRIVCIQITTIGSQYERYNAILSAMNPRGLATAVLATYPIILVENMLLQGPDERLENLAMQLSSLPELTFLIIILSVVMTSILVPLAARKMTKL
jgi:cell volume regulation protein A